MPDPLPEPAPAGLVDIHCHGGAGGDFASADPEQIRTAAAFHAAHGTGRMLASLVTAPEDDLVRQIEVLAQVVEAGDTVVGGIHLEGPFLSEPRCGAQNPAFLQPPSVAALHRWVDAGRGHVRMITLAPELPGALDVVAGAVDRGVVVAVGHTDATYDQCSQAFSRGATVATHLFNGMRPLHHRDPGPVGAALDHGVWCELIADGEHLHDATLRLVARLRPDRAVLVTDAMSAAGLPDGAYALGGQAVTVAAGAARLSEGGSLAGSTLTMRGAVEHALAAGVEPDTVRRMARENPAAAVGLTLPPG
ncbi:N-acetylglucosamine-6-phosphate deacetylase [Barrientosiimonas humi]|uniref:N-acetylglucosamine-6-phosphate deacetylase n=1 Tax=Barrientosiimonas humi TaxID=999931 RepID=UPI00370DB685